MRHVLPLLLFLVGVMMPAHPLSAARCPPAPRQMLHLPHTEAALQAGQPVLIVALGSSSTQGARASDAAHSYPALLQAELGRLWPTADVSVINRGIGGQDAAEELSRLHSDALALKPQMVIWQVGANGVLRDTSPAVFKQLVSAGLALLTAAGIDVVLMDNQRAPVILAQDHSKIDAALTELAAEKHVSLFSRAVLMDAWRDAGSPYSLFIDADGLHHNDRGYQCLASALAQAIAGVP